MFHCISINENSSIFCSSIHRLSKHGCILLSSHPVAENLAYCQDSVALGYYHPSSIDRPIPRIHWDLLASFCIALGAYWTATPEASPTGKQIWGYGESQYRSRTSSKQIDHWASSLISSGCLSCKRTRQARRERLPCRKRKSVCQASGLGCSK